jgi:hypothetical protein
MPMRELSCPGRLADAQASKAVKAAFALKNDREVSDE